MYRPYRRFTQLSFVALMFVIPVLNLFEIYAVTGTFYAINIGGLGISDPMVILQAIFASGELTIPLAFAAIFPVFAAFVFGRIWCGWMCPYHVLADAAAWLRAKFRAKALRETEPAALVCPSPLKANMFRFGFLFTGTVIAGAIGIPVLNYVSAPGILSTEAMILVKEHFLSIEFVFIGTLFLLELLFLPRFWCRMFCPTGSFISLFRTSFTLRVESDSKRLKAPCCKENSCTPSCPMGLTPYREGDNLLCTNCARCIDACRMQRLRFAAFQSATGSGHAVRGASGSTHQDRS